MAKLIVDASAASLRSAGVSLIDDTSSVGSLAALGVPSDLTPLGWKY